MPSLDVASYQSEAQTKTTAVTYTTHKFSYIINVTTGLVSHGQTLFRTGHYRLQWVLILQVIMPCAEEDLAT